MRSREELARRNAQVQALNELGQAMNSGLDLDESLELIAARAAEVLGAKASAIRLFVADGTLALATLYSQSEQGIDSTYEKRIADFVAATGEPILIDDLRTDKEPHVLGSSLLCVPLVLEESVVGTLTLLDKITTDRRDRRIFTALGAVGRPSTVLFPVRDLSVERAMGVVGGLIDATADPTGVFIFRTEPAAIAARILPGQAVTGGPRRIVYLLDLTRPGGMFMAREFIMRDGDTLYVTSAPFTKWMKILQSVAPLVTFTGSARTLTDF